MFAVEKGCTALVVGDLSGKGLAAAAQVSDRSQHAAVAFLYTQPTVAGAVTELNRVLAENDLLTGFATLFVGALRRRHGRSDLRQLRAGTGPRAPGRDGDDGGN